MPIQLKPSLAGMAIKHAIKAKPPVSVFVEGEPGVGKSSVIRGITNELGIEFRDVRASLLDPVDLRGLPSVDAKKGTKWNPPAFLPRDGEGVLLLDELNSAPRMVQAACYQLVLDRGLGEYTLPDGWAVVAAGNGEKDGAIVERMGTALNSRFLHIDFIPDLQDWIKDFAIPAGVATEIIAFLRFKSDLFHHFDRKAREFPCPRTWEFSDRLLKTTPPKEIEFAMFAGCVGEAAATAFVGFLRTYRQLPSIEEILLKPEKATLPEAPDALYAVSTLVAKYTTKANCSAVLKYVRRMSPEFRALWAQDSISRDKTIAENRDWIAWAAEDHNLIAA